MIDWDFNTRYGYGVVRFADGREAFLQGEEACELDDQVESCESCEDIERLLSAYDDVADFPAAADDDYDYDA